MGLIELCLLSLVAPQAPGAAVDPAPAASQAPQGQGAASSNSPSQGVPEPGGSEPGGPELGEPARLAQLEQAADYADTAELSGLALSQDVEVAARAAWILAGSKNAAHLGALPAIVAASPHAEVRLQALRGLRRKGDASCAPTAIAALTDDDRRVRTLAAQVLGKLRRPAAVDPLLQLVRAQSQRAADGPATDVQAAIVTLTDLGAAGHLLRMAADVADGKLTDCGEALAYAFQTLSPKLDPDQEATALIAVLDHKEPLVRRYAITRLSIMGNSAAIPALEGRLGKEGNALRPLLEVALGQLRGGQLAQDAEAAPKTGAAATALALGQRAGELWGALPRVVQAVLCALPVALLGMIWALRRAANQRRLAEDAAAAAALATPSDGFDDDEYADGDGDYEDDFDDELEHESGQGSFLDEDEEYDDQTPSLWQSADQSEAQQLEDEHAR